MTKKCTMCEKTKDLSNFHKTGKPNLKNEITYRARCKDCHSKICKLRRERNLEKYKLTQKEYYLNNKEKKQAYFQKNKEKIRDQKREWTAKNKELSKDRNRKRNKKYKDQKKIYNKEYRLNNKEKLNKQKNEYRKNRSTVNYKLSELFRVRIRSFLGNKTKTPRKCTLELLGCDYEYLKIYIESKFTKGMTWENRGKYGWHIDHIKPCSSFNLQDPEQQKLCFHYTNLQPLWGTTEIAVSYGESENYIGNIEKGNKII